MSHPIPPSAVVRQIAAIALLLGAGCHRPVETPTTEPATVEIPVANIEPAAAAAPDLAGTDDPADTIRRVIEEVSQGRSDQLAAALPQRYREDLDRWFREKISSIDVADRQQWAKGLERFFRTLREKQAFVLDSDRVELTGPAAEFVRERFGDLCLAAETLACWPGWSQHDAGSSRGFLDALVQAVAASPSLADEVRGIRVQNVAVGDETAVVRLTRASAEQGIDVPLVRIDGRWCPLVVAESWDKFNEDFSRATDRDVAAVQIGDGFERLEEIRQALAAVATQSEFDALSDKAAQLLLATAAQADSVPRAVGADEFVTVIVTGRLSDEQKDQLVWELAARSDSPVSGLADLTDRRDAEGVVARVGPVANIEEFARRLSGLAIEKVDAEKRTITARVAVP